MILKKTFDVSTVSYSFDLFLRVSFCKSSLEILAMNHMIFLFDIIILVTKESTGTGIYVI